MTLSLAACGDDQPVKVSPSLDAPTNLRAAERTSASITLAWQGPSDAKRFELERHADGDSAFAPLAQVTPQQDNAGSYLDAELAPRASFEYRVRALSDRVASEWSTPITLRTRPVAPLLQSVSALAGYTARITWSYDVPTARVELESRRNAGEWTFTAVLPASQQSYLDHFSNSFLTLEYRLRAIEEADTSSWSNTAGVHLDLYSEGPLGTVERLRDALVDLNEVGFSELLAPDYYFEPSSEDLAAHPNWRRRSSLATELAFFHALVNDPRRTNFGLTLLWYDPEPVTAEDRVESATQKIRLRDLNLVLATSTEDGASRQISIFDRNATVFLRDSGETWPSGQPKWELTAWRDRRSASEPTGANSWGDLHQFYAPDSVDVSDYAIALPEGDTRLVLSDGTGCGTTYINTDGSYESAYAWQVGAVQAPYYGAFAECFEFEGPALVCSVTLDLTATEAGASAPIDIYVWDDSDGAPGMVIFYRPGLNLETVETWPNLSRHDLPVEGYCFEGKVWMGFYGGTTSSGPAYYIGADKDGGGGCPMTNVSPALGVLADWRPAEEIFGPTQSLGIGCEFASCGDPVGGRR